MINIQEIKNLPAYEKWLIYETLRDDADVLDEIANEVSLIDSGPIQEQILKFIQKIDYRMDKEKSIALSMEEVFIRLKEKRKAS